MMLPAKLKGDAAYEKAKALNPFKAFERAASGYLDTVRIQRFLDGMRMLEAKGKSFEKDPQDFKDVADVINTFTGRASLGMAERVSEGLNKIFFSPRNWASVIKTATPYGLYHFGTMTPTGRKMAVTDFAKFVGLTTGMVAMAASYLNNDDDPETGVELDPRSTDFGKIRLGQLRADAWGGRAQQVILQARLIMDAARKAGWTDKDAYKTIKGETFPLGTPYKAKSAKDLLIQQAVNKLNPIMAIANRYFESRVKESKKKEDELVDAYGKPYGFSEELENEAGTIYMQTIHDMAKDKDGLTALDGLLIFYAFFGGGVMQYQSQEEKDAKAEPHTRVVP